MSGLGARAEGGRRREEAACALMLLLLLLLAHAAAGAGADDGPDGRPLDGARVIRTHAALAETEPE